MAIRVTGAFMGLVPLPDPSHHPSLQADLDSYYDRSGWAGLAVAHAGDSDRSHPHRPARTRPADSDSRCAHADAGRWPDVLNPPARTLPAATVTGVRSESDSCRDHAESCSCQLELQSWGRSHRDSDS